MPRIHNDTMWELPKLVTSLQVDQTAYPVGPDKTSYYILSWFNLNPITNETTVKCEVVEKFYENSKRKDLFKGSYKECHEYIEELVKNS